jgi:hypothetical protein
VSAEIVRKKDRRFTEGTLSEMVGTQVSTMRPDHVNTTGFRFQIDPKVG